MDNDRDVVKPKITIAIGIRRMMMARRKGSNANAGERLIDAAGRGFRVGGYGGAGVDGLAKEAGLTSGAFYAHFKSKAEAFRQVVEAGMHDLQTGIRHFRATQGSAWLPKFVSFYLSERRTCELGSSCALQSLTSEVMRADTDTRRTYTTELNGVIEAMAATGSRKDRGPAIALLALLSGGVTMARAVEDPALADEIAAAVRAAALRASTTAAPGTAAPPSSRPRKATAQRTS